MWWLRPHNSRGRHSQRIQYEWRPLRLSCVWAPCLLGPYLSSQHSRTKFSIFRPKSVPFPNFPICMLKAPLSLVTPDSLPSLTPPLHTHQLWPPGKPNCCQDAGRIHLHILLSNSGYVTSHLDHFNSPWTLLPMSTLSSSIPSDKLNCSQFWCYHTTVQTTLGSPNAFRLFF